MTIVRYDPISQAFHWVVAIAVLAAYALGWAREEMPKGGFRTALLNLHMSLGLLVFGLTVLRFMWRAGHPAPVMLKQAPLVMLAAKGAHVLLYAAMIAVPMSGLVSAWMDGRIVSFFWILPMPSPIALNKSFSETLGELHGVAAHCLMIVAGLHAAAAIIHHLIFKDAALERMLPARLQGARSSSPTKV